MSDGFLYGLTGWMLGTMRHSGTHNTIIKEVPTESYETIANKKKENELKEEELYLTKVKMFIDSIDVNCNKDDLELPVYDVVEESKYMSMFFEQCDIQNKITPFDGRWSQERHGGFYMFLKNKNVKTYDDEMMMKAYEKYRGWIKHFGKVVGKTNDRYDYCMYLKLGPSYQAKYMPQDELLDIISQNKYGYSKHLMGV